jgi:hypothetical protein
MTIYLAIAFLSTVYSLGQDQSIERFSPEWVYATRTTWDGTAEAGSLRAYDEKTGQLTLQLQPPGSNWISLTFAGGKGEPSRLFVARDSNPGANGWMRDVEVAELAAGGSVLNLTSLSNLLGTNFLGNKVAIGNIRFSQFPNHRNSIFLSVTTQKNGFLPSKVYELDLGLRKVLNVYTGPITTDNPPSIDFNPTNGEMYMVAQFLGATNRGEKKLGCANLIAFSYSPHQTNPEAYRILINGKTLARRDDPNVTTDPGWPHGRESVSMWHKPVQVVYRGTNHDDGRETLIVSTSWANFEMPQLEFYLDQTDEDGNLVRRSTFFTKYRVWNGQLDGMTGRIWFAPLYGFSSEEVEGLTYYDRQDSLETTSLGAQEGFSDCASPGVSNLEWLPNLRKGSRVISGNAGHEKSVGLPGPAVGFEEDSNIHALSYHVHDREQLINSIRTGQDFGKPVIISDDNPSAQHMTAAENNIALTSDLGGHYEHFDIHLGGDLRESDSGPRAHYGDFISSESDFPEESLSIIRTLGQYASHLEPGGQLTAADGHFRWNGRRVTLMGSSWMGALITKMCDIDGYLDVLENYGINLTRVWCIEQWTGTGQGRPGFERLAWVPFERVQEKWDLDKLDDQYFARVVEFIRKASHRGIIVQISLFDRAGLVDKPGSPPGTFSDSPYSESRNIQNYLRISGKPDPDRQRSYPRFTDLRPSPIWKTNERFIKRMANELSGFGNVIYEIMNEPHDAWPNIPEWHREVASTLAKSLEDAEADELNNQPH